MLFESDTLMCPRLVHAVHGRVCRCLVFRCFRLRISRGRAHASRGQDCVSSITCFIVIRVAFCRRKKSRMPKKKKGCTICGGEFHHFSVCPWPLQNPASPRKERETEEAYAARLRKNAYAVEWRIRAQKAPVETQVHRREKRRESGRERINKRMTIVADLKNMPCMDCGRRFPACAMDMDHRVPEEKHLSISAMSSGGQGTWEEFFSELSKCDVVCACCHRIRTHRQHEAARQETATREAAWRAARQDKENPK